MIVEEEVWTDIEGYEGLYQVSNLGNVKSLKGRNVNGKILRPLFTGFKNEYLSVVLYKDKQSQRHLIHRLVGVAYIPNPENKSEINHTRKGSDGKIDKTDNRAVSLAWATAAENVQHAWENGLMENTRKAVQQGNAIHKIVLNLLTGIFYDSAKEAAGVSHYKYGYFKSMLNGQHPNKTNFIYA